MSLTSPRRRLPRFLAALIAIVALAPAVAARATEIQRVVTPLGIEAWLVREPSIPMLALEMTFRGGAALDPADKGGLANMVSGLLDEGAGKLDSFAFQKRLEELAVGLSFDADPDGFSASLRTLTRHRDEAFAMLALALTAPRFDAEPVERIRRQIIAGLIREREDPGTIASERWMSAAFPDHPYGRPVSGTTESVARIQVADLRRFVAERLGRDNVVIGAVGDITAEELAALLDRTLGALPAKAAPAAVAEAEVAPGKGAIVVRKDIPQSVVSFGLAGVKRDDPDYYAAYVMNYVLGGGGFNSRLVEEVREKRGLAYSVYSYLHPLDHAGLWLGGVATANDRVAESVKLIRAELARMARDGVSPEELANAKTFLNGSFPLRLSSNAHIANMLVAIQLADLGIDYIARRPALIDAVTADDVKRVAARLLTPERMILVVVGDPKGIENGS